MKKTILIATGLLAFMAFSAVLCVVTQAAGTQSIPEVITLNSIEDKYEPVVFDHASHASMAGACGICHHQHGTDTTGACRDCHAIDASSFKKTADGTFLACRACHGAEYGSPDMPNLKVAYHRQCFGCHRDMGRIGVDPKGCTEQCHARK